MNALLFAALIDPFVDFPLISQRVKFVLNGLPTEVQTDFLTDPHFRVSLDDCEPGRGRTVMMAQLGPNGTSRCVVLKPRLERCSEAFACYIIAHEFAHAHLHNGGWGEITDCEDAADALAASWGFAKVPFELV